MPRCHAACSRGVARCSGSHQSPTRAEHGRSPALSGKARKSTSASSLAALYGIVCTQLVQHTDAVYLAHYQDGGWASEELCRNQSTACWRWDPLSPCLSQPRSLLGPPSSPLTHQLATADADTGALCRCLRREAGGSHTAPRWPSTCTNCAGTPWTRSWWATTK
jgi:hypothetical protein